MQRPRDIPHASKMDGQVVFVPDSGDQSKGRVGVRRGGHIRPLNHSASGHIQPDHTDFHCL